MTDRSEDVGEHYNEAIFDYEVERLEKHSPVEYAIMLRYLDRYIEHGWTVADIGVGVGHYAEHLAGKGCDLYLVDVSERMMGATVERLKQAELDDRIREQQIASAEDLPFLGTASVDAFLLLGPLYHLQEPVARRQVVQEAMRVLRMGGIIFAAGINRLAYFRDLYRFQPEMAEERRSFHAQFMKDGNVDPDVAPPLGHAHLTTIREMKLLFADGFERLALCGVESFAGHHQDRLHDLPPGQREAWLDLVEATGETTEGQGASEHLLYVGRRMGIYDGS